MTENDGADFICCKGGKGGFRKGGNSRGARPSGEKKKSTISFGTYLGNSLKDK